jgi:hypothetical protein
MLYPWNDVVAGAGGIARHGSILDAESVVRFRLIEILGNIWRLPVSKQSDSRD